ncbi:type II toxin-antitoxin system HipA family toxin [Thiolapillus sp.]|uniref:type II toxin-antitoxin system HipA family toxin n=3 Tax=Thiolapillus sp. TaxID=2017437 RepID=UPI003AF930C0
MKLRVTMDWPACPRQVGELDVFTTRGTESYQFTYSDEWIAKGFQIDPTLDLVPGFAHHSQALPGVFEDIAPDRWGRMVQQRVRSGFTSDIAYLLGVSDFMRMGALRLSDASRPDVYLADNHNVPKLIHIRELEEACGRLENGLETEDDLRHLFGPGSSLGGARPKAGVQDGKALCIAKFQSNQDTERVAAWEATMLDLAQKAGIPTARHRLLSKNAERPILLLERFDRREAERIPFASAMTLAGLRDGQDASYGELAGVVASLSSRSKMDSFDLWRRMVFNAMTGNTDDHLRNHAFLRDLQGWRLSPAYDLNPNNEPYTRRAHTLAFLPGENKPSLELCQAMAPYFNLDKKQVDHGLKAIGAALKSWKTIAKSNGLTDNEIQRKADAFEHEDGVRLVNGAQKQSKGMKR